MIEIPEVYTILARFQLDRDTLIDDKSGVVETIGTQRIKALQVLASEISIPLIDATNRLVAIRRVIFKKRGITGIEALNDLLPLANTIGTAIKELTIKADLILDIMDAAIGNIPKS